MKKPQIAISAIGQEFGIGFYVTPDREVAVRDAHRAVKKSFFYDSASPILNVYSFDSDNLPQSLRVIHLEQYSKQWLDFVLRCYTDIHFVHNYDIVFGNAVTADVEHILSQYRFGQVAEDETLAQLAQLPGVKQICFSTAQALDSLQYTESVPV